MFATLRYDRMTRAVEVAQSRPALGACVNCRAQKLRCSGERSGCERCLSRKAVCIFPARAKRRGNEKSRTTSQGKIRKSRRPGNVHLVGSSSSVSTQLEACSGSTLQSRNDTRTNLTGTAPQPLEEADTVIDSIKTNVQSAFTLDNSNLGFDLFNVDELSLPYNLGIFDLSGPEGPDVDTVYPPSNSDQEVTTFPTGPSPLANFGALCFNDLYTVASSATCRSSYSALPSPGSETPLFQCQNSNPSIPPFPGLKSCHCLTSISTLLETLSIEAAQHTLQRIPKLLSIKKRILNECETLLLCPSCSLLSHYLSLHILLYQKMAHCFGQTLSLLTQQYHWLQAKRNSDLRHGPQYESQALIGVEEHRMVIFDYDLDVDEEPCVLGALSLIQLRRLYALLGRMKGTARNWKWDSHVAIIDSTAHQVTGQMKLFDNNKVPPVAEMHGAEVAVC